MANRIQHRRTAYTGTGNPTDLKYGEIGWNNNNGNGGKLWIGSQRDDSNPPSIVNERINKSVSGTTNEISVSEAAEAFTVGLATNPTVSGNLTVNGDCTLGNAATDVVTIAGNLTVNGQTTTINSTEVSIDDLHFVLAADAADSSEANGAGIHVKDDIARFTYSHTGTKWVSSKPLDVTGTCTATAFSGPLTGNVTGNVTGDVTGSSGSCTGLAATATALATARTIGGVSFNGTANIDLAGVNITGNQDTSGNAATATALETARTIGGVSFNGTANIDLAGVNITGNQDTTGQAGSLASSFVIDGGTF